MVRYRRWYILLLATAVITCGCRRRPGVQQQGQAQAEPNQVLAVVDGVEFTSGQVDPRVEQWMTAFSDRLTQWPAEYVQQRRKEKRRQVLDQLIAEYLLDRQAEREQIVVTDSQVDQAIGQMAGQQQPPMSTQQFLEVLRQEGRDIQALRQEIRRQLTREALCEKALAGQIQVTEDQAGQYYQDHIDQFRQPEQVRASHILLRYDDKAPDPNKARAALMVKAEQLLAQISAGADFAELARAHSDCPSAKDGGDLGYFKKGEMEEPFEALAFELRPGQVAGPVQTSQGIHLIKVLDKRPAQTSTFDQAKEQVLNRLTAQQKQQRLRDYINILRSQARIEYVSQ